MSDILQLLFCTKNRQTRCACLKKGESELSLIGMIHDDREHTVNKL